MKTLLPILNKQTIVVALSALFLVFGGCNQNLTKQDVQEDIDDAREATVEAQEKTSEAIAAREQYYEDYKETKIKELEEHALMTSMNG